MNVKFNKIMSFLTIIMLCIGLGDYRLLSQETEVVLDYSKVNKLSQEFVDLFQKNHPPYFVAIIISYGQKNPSKKIHLRIRQRKSRW